MQLNMYMAEKMSQEIPKERVRQAEEDRLAMAVRAYADGSGASKDRRRRSSFGSGLRGAIMSRVLQFRG